LKTTNRRLPITLFIYVQYIWTQQYIRSWAKRQLFSSCKVRKQLQWLSSPSPSTRTIKSFEMQSKHLMTREISDGSEVGVYILASCASCVCSFWVRLYWRLSAKRPRTNNIVHEIIITPLLLWPPPRLYSDRCGPVSELPIPTDGVINVAI